MHAWMPQNTPKAPPPPAKFFARLGSILPPNESTTESTHARTHAHTHTRTHARTHTCTHAHASTCQHMPAHASRPTHTAQKYARTDALTRARMGAGILHSLFCHRTHITNESGMGTGKMNPDQKKAGMRAEALTRAPTHARTQGRARAYKAAHRHACCTSARTHARTHTHTWARGLGCIARMISRFSQNLRSAMPFRCYVDTRVSDTYHARVVAGQQARRCFFFDLHHGTAFSKCR